METTELIKKVRKIEIKTKGLSNHLFSGEYHTAFKGKGMSFSEVREYQYGDDIRAIDWNVTARFNHPYIKVFEEERELTVMILIDISRSSFFGSQKAFKSDIITEICAVIAFSALNNNDKVGVIFFSDCIEKFIPPKKGKSHVLRIIREMLNFEPAQKGTRIDIALQYLINIMKKKSICFVLSDFMDQNFQDALNIASKKHDIIGIKVFDDLETQLPDIGLIQVLDAESGKKMWIDTSDAQIRKQYAVNYLAHADYTKNAFLKSGADIQFINTKDDYVKKLMNLFNKRGHAK